MVKVHADVVKVEEDLLWRSVLLDLALGVEADHVGRRERARDLELLLESVLLDRLLALLRKRDDEVHRRVRVVLLVVLHRSQQPSSEGAKDGP